MSNCPAIATPSFGHTSCYDNTVKNCASGQNHAALSVPSAIAAITVGRVDWFPTHLRRHTPSVPIIQMRGEVWYEEVR